MGWPGLPTRPNIAVTSSSSTSPGTSLSTTVVRCTLLMLAGLTLGGAGIQHQVGAVLHGVHDSAEV